MCKRLSERGYQPAVRINSNRMNAVSAFFKQQPEQHLSPGLFVFIHETLILTRAKHLARPQGLTRSEASLHEPQALYTCEAP